MKSAARRSGKQDTAPEHAPAFLRRRQEKGPELPHIQSTAAGEKTPAHRFRGAGVAVSCFRSGSCTFYAKKVRTFSATATGVKPNFSARTLYGAETPK